MGSVEILKSATLCEALAYNKQMTKGLFLPGIYNRVFTQRGAETTMGDLAWIYEIIRRQARLGKEMKIEYAHEGKVGDKWPGWLYEIAVMPRERVLRPREFMLENGAYTLEGLPVVTKSTIRDITKESLQELKNLDSTLENCAKMSKYTSKYILQIFEDLKETNKHLLDYMIAVIKSLDKSNKPISEWETHPLVEPYTIFCLFEFYKILKRQEEINKSLKQ